MRTVLRFLLISLSIAALTSTIVNADEPISATTAETAITDLTATVSTTSETKPAVVTPPPAPTPEVIPKSYVTVSAETKTKTLSSLLLSAVSRLVKPAQEKIYSLLNWKNGHRAADLEVVSYNRVAHFGKWAQDKNDKTCYNTRAKVLIRDSVKPVLFSVDNACSVDKGEWNDPYAGKVLTDAKAEIQIDHMVPLKNAYVSGAHAWDFKSRCLYANYLGESFHLISVDGIENQRKGDKAPDQYMPSNKSYMCTYLKNWLTVKALWGLEMTPAEADGIKGLISSEGCNVADFVLSESEIQTQRQFAFDNAELCFVKQGEAK